MSALIDGTTVSWNPSADEKEDRQVNKPAENIFFYLEDNFSLCDSM